MTLTAMPTTMPSEESRLLHGASLPRGSADVRAAFMAAPLIDRVRAVRSGGCGSGGQRTVFRKCDRCSFWEPDLGGPISFWRDTERVHAGREIGPEVFSEHRAVRLGQRSAAKGRPGNRDRDRVVRPRGLVDDQELLVSSHPRASRPWVSVSEQHRDKPTPAWVRRADAGRPLGDSRNRVVAARIRLCSVDRSPRPAVARQTGLPDRVRLSDEQNHK